MATATVTQTSNFQRGQRVVHASSAAQLVNLTLDHEINTSGVEFLFVELTVAVAALTGFAIAARPSVSGTYVTLYNVATDFTIPKGLIIGASGDLTTQGVGTGWFIMNVSAIESVKLTATSAGTATVATEVGGA